MKAADCEARVVALVASLVGDIAAEFVAVARHVTTGADAGLVFQRVAVAARSHVISGALPVTNVGAALCIIAEIDTFMHG